MIKKGDLFFNKVTIIGVGLIGASFALALKEKGLCKNIIGCGRKENNLRQAKKRRIIDDYTLDVSRSCKDSDLILLSTPVGAFTDIIKLIRGTVKKGAVISDVGSVKGSLVYALESLMPKGVYYIGSHPIAGSDSSGIDDARADLFNNARCIITPTAKSNKKALKTVTSIWEKFGSRVELIDPLKHDEIFGAVSHFPHVVAYAVVNTLESIDSDYIKYAGEGFKDTTRIAMSSPELWRDISLFNRANLLKMIDIFRDNLDEIVRLLEKGDSAGIEKEFSKAQDLRMKIK
ncbi:MAG: prephenate dehydrogenase/arogenate dehydrogenase family protein [Thermodesulfovibrio sp.]|nr:prephenate dehydrogenase/arogenate dehydrogenase family protein [Thermodesulfovibrio sp.]